MSAGTPGRAPLPGDRLRFAIRSAPGASTFAEDPAIGAPDAQILWSEALDPGTLSVIVEPVPGHGPDAIDLEALSDWLTIVDGGKREHAVLSDGWRRIRLDIDAGTLRGGGLVRLRYQLIGVRSAEPKLLPLRRLLTLCRAGRFAPGLFPTDRRIPRWLQLLRVADARAAGASYRDIALVLYGEERTRRDWREGGRSLQSRVRRLVAGARVMAAGGYRQLLRTKPSPGIEAGREEDEDG